MAVTFTQGDYVVWNWAGGHGHGTVTAVSSDRTEITSKGSTIVRNGTPDNPAVTIKDHNQTIVLKLASELTKADKDSD